MKRKLVRTKPQLPRPNDLGSAEVTSARVASTSRSLRFVGLGLVVLSVVGVAGWLARNSFNHLTPKTPQAHPSTSAITSNPVANSTPPSPGGTPGHPSPGDTEA